MAPAGPLRLYSTCSGSLAGMSSSMLSCVRELVSLLGCMNYRQALAVLARAAALCGLLALAGAGPVLALLLLALLVPLLLLGAAAGWRWPGRLEQLRQWLCAPAAVHAEAGR